MMKIFPSVWFEAKGASREAEGRVARERSELRNKPSRVSVYTFGSLE